MKLFKRKKQDLKTLLLPVACCLLPLLTPFTPGVLAVSPGLTVLVQTPEAPKAKAEQHFTQGVEQLNANQLDEALESFQRTVNIQQQNGNRFGEAVTLNNLGIVYYYQGQYEQAIASYQESMKLFWSIYESSEDTNSSTPHSGIATSLNNQSIVHLQLGDYQKAIELCHGAMAIFRNMGDRTREAAAINNMGIAYEMLEDYERAIGYFQEALATAQSIDDARGEVVTLNNLKDVYTKLGQAEKVKEIEQQALAILQEIRQAGDTGGTVSSNDYLLVRQKERSLAIIFSQLLQ